MNGEDEALMARLRALQGGSGGAAGRTVPTDDEMLERVRAVRGVPHVPPRAPPAAGRLPPMSSATPSPPAAPHPVDQKLGKVLGAIVGEGGDAAAAEAEALLAMVAEGVELESRLEGGRKVTQSGVDLDASAALGSGAEDDAPLVAPTRAAVSGMSHDAAAVLDEVGAAGVPLRAPPRGRGAGGALGFDELCAGIVSDDECDEDEAEELLRAVQEGLALEAEAEAVVGRRQPTVPAPAAAGRALDEAAATDFPSAPKGAITPPTAGESAAARAAAEQAEMDRWCSICTEDADRRCAGCDNDAFCARCWREGHAGEEDLRCHRTVPIRRRPP